MHRALAVSSVIAAACFAACSSTRGVAPNPPPPGFIHPMALMNGPLDGNNAPRDVVFTTEALAAYGWSDPQKSTDFDSSGYHFAEGSEIEDPKVKPTSPSDHSGLIAYFDTSNEPAQYRCEAGHSEPVLTAVESAGSGGEVWLYDAGTLQGVNAPVLVNSDGLNGWVFTSNSPKKAKEVVAYVRDLATNPTAPANYHDLSAAVCKAKAARVRPIPSPTRRAAR
jgi:hypothetical protein